MISLSILKNRQIGLFAAAGALLLAVVLPTIVGAAQLTERSVAVSSASKTATGVTYGFKFTSAANAAGALIEFCENTPLIGETCDAPGGFDATGAVTTGVTVPADNLVKVVQAITGEEETTITLTGLTNPTATGPFYARIVTYDNTTNLTAATGTATVGTGAVDQGSASIIITDSIGVSGAVLESLTFCVAGNDNIGPNCTPTVPGDGLTAPTLRLGQQVGDAIALTPGTMSSGSIYTQLSTNSASGAIVSLKSSTLGCGGLVRAGAPSSCDISPALDSDVTNGDATAKFGIKPAAATGGTGILRPYDPTPQTPSPYYSASAFKMKYVIGDATGVTSTFGDPFLDTAGAPASNKNMTITFGASVINETPAGLYSADLSLIATGKF